MELQEQIFDQMNRIEKSPQFLPAFLNAAALDEKIATHRAWLQGIRRERPDPAKPYRIGVYIRYFNQTRYQDYLDYHKRQFMDTIGLCPNWTLVDFYVDEGSTAPNMESSPAWCQLLEDCMDGKVDLILTQKISNVSRKFYEINFCARLLARQIPPIGIYFISEDMFTLASYYANDPSDGLSLPGTGLRRPLEEAL